MKWTCVEKERVLQFDTVVLEQFLKPVTGISILILHLEKIVCSLTESEKLEIAEGKKFLEGSENRELVNWLIYFPEKKIIERFDPRGNRAFTYDIIQLDSKLFDLFQAAKPGVNYMCLSQSEFSSSLSHASIFSLIYMHSRILQFVNSSENDSPLEFQARLLHSLEKKSSKQLTKYASGYTKKLLNIKNRIIKSKDYLDAMPFWSNAIIQLSETLRKLQGKFNSKNKKQLSHLENIDQLANDVFQAFD
jgi:hypothetical protein